MALNASTTRPSRISQRTSTKRDFLQEFIKAPITTASVTPSSRSLAEQMTAPIPQCGEPVVVELGPGTGAITKTIQQRLAGRGQHITVELHPRWAEELGRRFPLVESICDDARALPELLARRGVQADVVVSGLPATAHTQTNGVPLASLIAAALKPTGVFTQFAYTWSRWIPPARRELNDLRTAFEETVVSRTIWRNLPPATIYLARRPI